MSSKLTVLSLGYYLTINAHIYLLFNEEFVMYIYTNGDQG